MVDPPSAPVHAVAKEDVTGRRAAAAILDGVAIFFIIFIVGFVVGVGGATDAQGHAPHALTPLAYLLALAYQVIEIVNGRSPGKAALGLTVERADGGGRPSATQLLIRNVVRVVDALPFLYLIGLISMAASKQDQRVGDRAAGTVVVRA